MIIYFNNGANPFSTEFKNSGYEIVTPYKKSIKVRLIRELEKVNLFKNFLYNTKEIKPRGDEIIIVFDSNITKSFLEWLRKKYPLNRIIFWFWNPVNSFTTTISPQNIPEGIEKWSYSPFDCQKYKLNYNTTFMFNSLVQANILTTNTGISKKTALFVGRDKGRLKELLCLKEKLEKAGIICDFHIIGNRPSKEYNYEKPFSYKRVVEMIKKADILIDYYTDETAGLSLRPMEALFFEKKLITNNRMIKNYDFYNTNNILILDDDTSNFRQFATSSYVKISNAIRDEYLLSNWIERF